MDSSINCIKKMAIYTEKDKAYFYLILSTKINSRLMGYYEKQNFRTFRTFNTVLCIFIFHGCVRALR